MKINLLLSAAIVLTFSVHAQTTCNWAYIPDGANAHNTISNVALDHQGNIIETGRILGIGDMDPGAGPADTSFSATGYNYYVSKTTSAGHLLWVKYFKSTGPVQVFDFNGVLVNSQDEIIILGKYFGLVDFDLSDAGVDTLRSHMPTYEDYFLAKYDVAGDLVWAFSIGDVSNRTQIQNCALLPNDNILVTTNTNGPVDVDPGINTHNTLGGNANLICYDSNGNYVWNNNIATTYSYSDNLKILDGDAVGNSYLLTVGYYELTVNKFDQNGNRVWDHTIGEFSSGARVNPQSVLVDKVTGDFYVAGTFDDTVDFDPGPAVVTKICNNINYQEGFIARYDSSMNLVWVNAYPAKINFGNYSMDFSVVGVVLVGNVQGTVDFGNGFVFNSPSVQAPFFLEIDPYGNSLDAYVLAGNGGGYNTIQLLNSQSFVASGNIFSTLDLDPSGADLTLTVTSNNFFTAVYASGTTGVQTIAHENSTTVYPNPAKEEITVLTKNEVNALLCDLVGNEIRNYSLNPGVQNKINVTDLDNGIYLLRTGSTLNKITVIH